MIIESGKGGDEAADIEANDSIAKLGRKLEVLASVRELLARLAAKMEEGDAGKPSK